MEMLVVISIVLILAVLSSGTLLNAIDSGKSATSIGNLRKIGSAYHAYAIDHNGMFPIYTWGDAPRQTLGSVVNQNSPVKKLFSRDSPLGGLPEGGDYMDSCDAFYSPFAIRYKKRAKSAYYKDSSGVEYIGYCCYSLPSEDRSETPPRAPVIPEIFNDRVTQNPRSPFYSDLLADQAAAGEFKGKSCTVLHLDGSVSSVSMTEMKKAGSWADRIQLMVESH